MNTRIGILVISVITPGLIVLAISLYYFGTDYTALIKAESYVKELVETPTSNERKLAFAYHRALAHRINVFADGTWGLLGGAIAALGIHGIVTIKEKDI